MFVLDLDLVVFVAVVVRVFLFFCFLFGYFVGIFLEIVTLFNIFIKGKCVCYTGRKKKKGKDCEKSRNFFFPRFANCWYLIFLHLRKAFEFQRSFQMKMVCFQIEKSKQKLF